MASSDQLQETMESSSSRVSREKLLIIEWEHMNKLKFYPMILASSGTIRCFLYPMSVVKNRLQLQRQNNVYRGMRHAFVEILRTEGIGALYRGFWMTLPQLSASFIYSSIYERTRNFLQKHMLVQNDKALAALAGGLACPCAQMVFVPTDIVAQHMMIHNNPEKFAGKKDAPVAEAVRTDGLAGKRTLGLRVVRAVYKVDGISGFYRGFLSSIMLYIPSTMVFWATYYHALDIFRKRIRTHMTGVLHGKKNVHHNDIDDRFFFLDQAVCGSIAGVASAIATNPMDMLRVRLQVHRTSFKETVTRLWKYEKFNVFTKGLAPRVVNNGLYSSLLMLAYETAKKLSVMPEYSSHVVW